MASEKHIETFTACGKCCLQTRTQLLKIDRILTHYGWQGVTKRIRQDDAAAFEQPQVVLGDLVVS